MKFKSNAVKKINPSVIFFTALLLISKSVNVSTNFEYDYVNVNMLSSIRFKFTEFF